MGVALTGTEILKILLEMRNNEKQKDLYLKWRASIANVMGWSIEEFEKRLDKASKIGR